MNAAMPSSTAGSTEPRDVSRRRRATRDRLLDATREVVAAKGIHGASVEEICELAGFTRGAFYSNYADKDEIVLELARREQARIFGLIGSDVAATDLGTTVDAVLATQQPQLSYYLMQSEITLHALRTPDFTPVALASDEAFRVRIRDILATAMDALDLEPVVDLDDIAECVTALNERSIRTAALSGEEDLLRLARTLLPRVLQGLTRPRGRGAAST